MHDLNLRISDNGVGIDSNVAEQGKGGHFGLRGMRERDAKFTPISSAGEMNIAAWSLYKARGGGWQL